MNQIEMRRFAVDLRSRPDLADKVRRQPGLDKVIEVARAEGYQITTEDLLQYLYGLFGGRWEEGRPHCTA